jgi:hypothetical protein
MVSGAILYYFETPTEYFGGVEGSLELMIELIGY